MNYSEPLLSQFAVFFKSIGVGVILGVWYVIISFIRTVIGEKRFVYITSDIIFALSSAILSFMFMVLFNSGKIRFNLMFGELCGCAAFYFGVGKYVLSFLSKWVWAVRKTLRFIFSPFRKLIRKLPALTCILRVKFAGKLKCKYRGRGQKEEKYADTPAIKKKFFNYGKIHLKNKNKSV